MDIANHFEQRRRYVLDFATYGIKQNGMYKGIPWLMVRAPMGISWNVYISLPECSPEQYEKLNSASHCGITGSAGIYDGVDYDLGFDCAHAGDWAHDDDSEFNMLMGGTYKDYQYVLSTIYQMIDAIRPS